MSIRLRADEKELLINVRNLGPVAKIEYIYREGKPTLVCLTGRSGESTHLTVDAARRFLVVSYLDKDVTRLKPDYNRYMDGIVEAEKKENQEYQQYLALKAKYEDEARA